MRILIIGGGKLGYNLSKTMIENGHDIILIESDNMKCLKLADELDIPVICGNGTRLETLEQLEAQDCDILIAVTGHDEDNLVACQLGKIHFNIPRTVARANNPKNIAIMEKLGVNIVVSSTSIIANMIESEVETAAVHLITNINNGEANIIEYTLPSNWSKSGIRLQDMELPTSSVVVSIIRSNNVYIPRGGSQIFSGDDVVLLTMEKDLKKLKKIFEL